MDREYLSGLRINELRAVGARWRVDVRGSRIEILKRLLNYFEEVGWPSQSEIPQTSSSQRVMEARSDMATVHEEEQREDEARTSTLSATTGRSPVELLLPALGEAPRQASAFRNNRLVNGGRETTAVGEDYMARWNQIQFVSKLIPSFSANENESVTRWLDRISGVARIYGFPDKVLSIAAVSQLKGRALEWYNRQPIESVTSWEDFKYHLRHYFDNRETYTTTLTRIGQRTWRAHAERFVDYVEEKLNLMESLNLSEQEKIELLADGIRDPMLRRFALSAQVHAVPDLIDYVRRITEDAMIPRRVDFGAHRVPRHRSEPVGRQQRCVGTAATVNRACYTCGKQGHLSRDCRNRGLICFKCGQPGHRSSACTSGTSRYAASGSVRPTSSGATVNQLVRDRECSTGGKNSVDSRNVGCVKDFKLSEAKVACVKVKRLSHERVAFTALVDTGSPVCLVRSSVYQSYFSDHELLRVHEGVRLKGLNDAAVSVIGKIYVQIVIENLPSWFDILLFVVEDNTMDYEMLIGRDFLSSSGLKLIYHRGECTFECSEISENHIYTILPIDAVESRETYDTVEQNLSPQLSLKDKNQLFKAFQEVDNLKLSPIEDNYCIQVHMKDESYFRYSPRRMSVAEKKDVDEITADLLKRGIIKPSISPYCSRVILVNKRNGKKRLCVDLRPLNQRVYPQKYPFPVIEDQIDKLFGKCVYTKLDLKDGFHQIAIDPDHTKYFSFATHNGQYEYVKMPFGYSQAPAEFQKRILYIFRDLIQQEKLMIYMDDILIATDNVPSNLAILKEVLIILKKYGMEMNLSKCMFLAREIEYLGYVISKDGITLSDRHVQAILQYPKPNNVRELQGFLGLTNYFRKFIKDFAMKAKPLQNLIKKNAEFHFHSDCEASFALLKKELTSPPVLHLYNPAAETELHTDASSHGFGAILLQRQSEGYLAPIAYFSKSTSDTEKKYHSFELETLAIVKAIERFHVYLQGIQFKIVTDCNSLVLAMKKININPRIARWSLALQNYRFEMVHRPAEKMTHVDCLSRNIMMISVITSEDELMYKQLADTKLKALAEELEVREDKHFTLINGLIFRNYKDKQLFVVPEAMVNGVIRIHHDEMGHVGLDKTVQGILANYWFPCLKIKVKEYIENCVKCLSYSLASGKSEGELELYEKATVPMHTVHIDHFGPLSETVDGYKYILVMVDAFTKYVWLCACKTLTTGEVLNSLTALFDQFGVPNVIVSDRGTAFTSAEFSDFSKGLEFKHVLTAVASPWANGQVERVNRFLKSILSKLVDDPSNWKRFLNRAQFVINNTHHKAINATPCKLLFGYEHRRWHDNHVRELIKQLTQVDTDLVEERSKARDAAQLVNRAMQEYNKSRYDARHKKPTRYKEGDLVLVKVLQHRPGTNQKLVPKFKGPYQIKKLLNKKRYVVTDVPGYPITQRPFNTILSADKLKPWIRVAEPTSESE